MWAVGQNPGCYAQKTMGIVGFLQLVIFITTPPSEGFIVGVNRMRNR